MANPFDDVFGNPDYGKTTEKDANPFDSVFGNPNYKPRSAIGEIGNQLKAGALVELPQMVGDALKYTGNPGDKLYGYGKSLSDWAAEQGKRPDLQAQPESHGIVTNALASGARMLPQSLAPAALVGAGIAAAPVEIPAALGLGAAALLGSAPAAMSQGQQTLEKAREAGVPEDKAIEAARINALIEGGGETLGTYFGGKLLGIGGRMLGKAGTPAGNALSELTNTKVLKPFAKALGAEAAVETGTEIGQNAGEAAVEKAYGIDTKSPYEAGVEAIAPTLGMTALLAPFGLAGHGLRSRNAARNTSALSSEQTAPEVRGKIADYFAKEIGAADQQAGANFRANAEAAIQSGRPLQIDESLFSARQPTQTAATPPAIPSIDPNAGPLSRAAATSVATGAAQAQQAAAAAGAQTNPPGAASGPAGSQQAAPSGAATTPTAVAPTGSATPPAPSAPIAGQQPPTTAASPAVQGAETPAAGGAVAPAASIPEVPVAPVQEASSSPAVPSGNDTVRQVPGIEDLAPYVRSEEAAPSQFPEAPPPPGANADKLYPAAVDMVMKTLRPSISLVQRHLRIGYNRASQLIEQMERDGFVSPPDAAGVRSVIAKPEDHQTPSVAAGESVDAKQAQATQQQESDIQSQDRTVPEVSETGAGTASVPVRAQAERVDAPQAQGPRPAGVEAQPVLPAISNRDTPAQPASGGQDALAPPAGVQGDGLAPATLRQTKTAPDLAAINVPLSQRGDLNAEIDRNKREEAAQAKQEAKTSIAQRKADKARAKELFAQYGEAIVAQHGAKFGEKETRKTLDSMVKWEPAKFIQLAETFQREQQQGEANARVGSEVPGTAAPAEAGVDEAQAQSLEGQAGATQGQEIPTQGKRKLARKPKDDRPEWAQKADIKVGDVFDFRLPGYYAKGRMVVNYIDNDGVSVKGEDGTGTTMRAGLLRLAIAGGKAVKVAPEQAAPAAKSDEVGAAQEAKPDATAANPDSVATPVSPQAEAPAQSKAADNSQGTAEREASGGQAEQPSEPGKKVIKDFGEKIGGARKDMSDKGEKRRKAASTDERPAWARRFSIAQVVGSSDAAEKGKWVINDTKTLNWMKQPRQVGKFDTEQEAKDALPLIAVALNHRVVQSGTKEAPRYEIWRDITDRKRVKVVGKEFASRDEAMQYMAEHATEIIEANTTFGEADLPIPTNKQRVGAERRQGDVTETDFERTFGMRATEFGNWNNQEERQTLMNDAYDGLLDLAGVLGIPPKSIGLNGDLALAFGARGHGLSGARAHYERPKAVINLTKEKGAGTLAHEWFHAMDHYFGRQDGKASSKWEIGKDGTKSLKSDSTADYASHGFSWRDSGVREEVRTAYKNLIDTLFRKAATYVEDTAKADKFTASAKEDLAQKLDSLRKELSEQKDPRFQKRNNKPATSEQLGAFDTVASRLLSGEIGPLETGLRNIEGSRAAKAYRWTSDNLEEISRIYKEVRGRSGWDSTNNNGLMDNLRQHVQRYSQRLKMLADAQAQTEKTKTVPTSFAMDAKELDQGRGEDYWTTPHEMAARAFQGYVEDKVAERGGKSPFLNYAPENAAIETPWGWKRPYPHGEERKAINAALNRFVQTLETKETDRGTAMFSRGTSAGMTMRDTTVPITPAAFKQSIAALRQAFPGVRIIAHDSDSAPTIPKTLREQIAAAKEKNPEGMAGAFHEGAVHLFRSGIQSVDQAEKVTVHELTHRGLARIFGLGINKPFLDIHASNQNVADAADRIAKQYGYGKALATEEALADMGANMVGVRGFDKLVAYVRTALRKLGLVSEWSDNDVALLVQRARGRSQGGMTESAKFARTSQVRDAVQQAFAARTVTDVGHRFANRLRDLRGIGLQFLGRRQIADIYKDDLPQLTAYDRLAQQMDAEKNKDAASADSIADRWGKLKDERPLAELMHDATRDGIDPDKAPDANVDVRQYAILKRRFNALSDDAKAIYREARDAYDKHWQEVRSAITNKIMRAMPDSPRRAELLHRMDDEFFGRVKGVYFPLARFGDYVVTVKDSDGNTVAVSMAETLTEAETMRREMIRAYPNQQVGKITKRREFNAGRDAVGRGFMQDLYGVLDKQGVASDELQDAINQLYLSSLPDLSWAKHGIHRKGTPGFSQDARRAFAKNMFHGARYLAKLNYADQLQGALTAMQDHVDENAQKDGFDAVRAQQVVDEMAKRHDAYMNPKVHPLATALTSAGFIYHMGMSPASAITNLTQTPLVAFPIMGAKWGFRKAAGALLKASEDAVKAKNDLTKTLKGDELKAVLDAIDAGTIDVTQSHDLAGIAQGEDSGVMWKLRPVMKWSSFLFHHTERFNRQATFLAAYRLAREAGTDHQGSYEQATKATYDAHFDYAAGNRPRVMQGNTARVALLFKQYAQNMIYTLTRNAMKAAKGDKEAQKAIGGILAMHAMAAGMFGLPLVGTILSMASMLGDDDDDPWDAKIALRNWLAEAIGEKPAEVLVHGFSRLGPADISGRVGLNTLLFPDIQEGLEGEKLWDQIATSALGPVAGIGANVFKGAQEIGDGRWLRGIETMMPAAARGAVKSFRYASEGAKDKTGLSIVDDTSLAAELSQLVGFSPSTVREATEAKSAIYQADRRVESRRRDILEQYALARMAGDTEGVSDARESIGRFNEKNPARRIDGGSLVRSVAMRNKRIREAEQGVYLPKSHGAARAAGAFADDEE